MQAEIDDKEDKNNRFYLLDRYYLKPFFTVAYEPKTLGVPIQINDDPEDFHHNDQVKGDQLIENMQSIQMEEFEKTEEDKIDLNDENDDEEHR